jgi:Uma2 family endonuclease
MSTAATKMHHSAEDLLIMPDGDFYELVHGNLVERKMSLLSSYVAGVIFSMLFAFCRLRTSEWVFPEGTSYQCFSQDPDKVRKPDVSFIRLERLSAEKAAAKGHARIAPDLAVEVISPNDLYDEVDEKIKEWLSAGVQLIWVVSARTHTVTVHRADGTSAIFHENDELTGENVLPGFHCQVRDFLLLPTETSPA